MHLHTLLTHASTFKHFALSQTQEHIYIYFSPSTQIFMIQTYTQSSHTWTHPYTHIITRLKDNVSPVTDSGKMYSQFYKPIRLFMKITKAPNGGCLLATAADKRGKHSSHRQNLAAGLCSFCAQTPAHINLTRENRAASVQSWKLSLNGPVRNLNGCGMSLFDSPKVTGVQKHANNNLAPTHTVFIWKETFNVL